MVSFLLSHCQLHSQAILHQFARTRKATDDEDGNEEDEDLFNAMEEPEDEQDVEACDGEDEDREASDEAMLANIDRELTEEVDEHDLPKLTREDINVGRFSIYKVSKPIFRSLRVLRNLLPDHSSIEESFQQSNNMPRARKPMRRSC
jgi:hypothetical protein